MEKKSSINQLIYIYIYILKKKGKEIMWERALGSTKWHIL